MSSQAPVNPGAVRCRIGAAHSLARVLILLLACHPAGVEAVENRATFPYTYNTSNPTGTDIPNWTTGWGAGGVTGWDYVGIVNGASGVYLGNGWVLTAAHVGAGTFTLSGTPYNYVGGTAQGIGTADLTLFKIATAPALPALTLAGIAPIPYSASPATPGSSVVMIGYGGGQGRTWGLNTVTGVNANLSLDGYTTTVFNTGYGFSGVTNSYYLVSGDSGGAAFIYDSAQSAWALSGIHLAVDIGASRMAQMNTYASQINGTTLVPEPSAIGLLAMGILTLLGKRRGRCPAATD